MKPVPDFPRKEYEDYPDDDKKDCFLGLGEEWDVDGWFYGVDVLHNRMITYYLT